jgi:predicted metal-dependent enzyme (double-stranded beta helix superfamily)
LKELKYFAEKNFPVKEVSHHLQDIEIKERDLKKYNFILNDRYTRNLIYKNNDFELLLLCWAPKVLAPIHGHEGEKCWAKILSGELEISSYKKYKDSIRLKDKRSCKPGYLDGPADIHSVKNITSNFAMTLHVYAKPYDTCDIYMNDLKTIQRVKLDYFSIDGVKC